MRIFLDANILFSGSFPRSRMRVLLALLRKQARLLTNAYAIEEARRNLSLKAPECLPRLAALARLCEHVSAIAADLPVALADKDRPILGGAIAGRATHLLTGDERDFGLYFGATIRGVTVLPPRLLIADLRRRGFLQ